MVLTTWFETLQNSTNVKYHDLVGVPKALLPGIGKKKIIDSWWAVLKMYVFSFVVVVMLYKTW